LSPGSDGSPRPDVPPPAGWAPAADPDEVLGSLVEHFGVAPAVFAGHRLWEKSPSRSIWIAAADLVPPVVVVAEVLGVRVYRRGASFAQVSSAFVRRFLGDATRHVADLEGVDQVAAWLAEPAIPWRSPWSEGYFVVRSPWGVLGRGRLHAGLLHCELPRHDRGPVVSPTP